MSWKEETMSREGDMLWEGDIMSWEGDIIPWKGGSVSRFYRTEHTVLFDSVSIFCRTEHTVLLDSVCSIA